MGFRVLALSLLVALVVAAVFGLYVPMISHASHEAGCPFVPGSISLCAAPLAHLEHWQAAFAAVLAELLVLCTLAPLFLARHDLFDPDIGQRSARRPLQCAPIRPTLFQELFSRGILNRKEAHCS